MLKQRKAPIKVEPKVFFANERTFLAWMHISIILAGASIAILAFSGSSENPGSQLYGVVMLPVAIAFIIYSMYQCECTSLRNRAVCYRGKKLISSHFLTSIGRFVARSQDVRRAYMIRNKHPGPYDDTVGPTVLGIMLMLSIVAQFAIKLYSMSV